MREIGAAVGLGSPSSVAHHLKTLERHGLLRRTPGGPRAVDARPPVGNTPTGLVGRGTLFALRVRGDSMVDAGIANGDVIVVRQQAVADNGDIVAAMIDHEATVKQYRTRDGKVELVPHNPHYPVIPGDRATILGKIVCVLHRP
ncbi:transcriptional repressor LexA [Micromonospora gifhornensis]|uniref:LexA repressor n=1 Tax=Micromonospora gifhornensis TaxID=84594 RepID=A0ABQ4IKS7_9ACTN|nr:LexA repressor [Micromonospora gifhornensis]